MEKTNNKKKRSENDIILTIELTPFCLELVKEYEKMELSSYNFNQKNGAELLKKEKINSLKFNLPPKDSKNSIYLPKKK